MRDIIFSVEFTDGFTNLIRDFLALSDPDDGVMNEKVVEDIHLEGAGGKWVPFNVLKNVKGQ